VLGTSTADGKLHHENTAVARGGVGGALTSDGSQILFAQALEQDELAESKTDVYDSGSVFNAGSGQFSAPATAQHRVEETRRRPARLVDQRAKHSGVVVARW